MSLRSIDVRVRFQTDTYVVRHGQRLGSCTWSAAEAVRRLAVKLSFAAGEFDVVRQGVAADGDGEVWRIAEITPGQTAPQR